MQIRKAVITAASPTQARLPLQSVVDRSGAVRTALELLLDDISGNTEIEETAIVVCPGMTDTYQQAVGNHVQRVVFIEQHQPRGYGDALLRTKEFVGDSPFLHLVGDHLYVSRNGMSCAQQLIEVARREQAAVSAIQATRENQLGFFGAIGGTPVPRQPGLYEVHAVVEKPTPTVAEQQLVVAGQRAGHYLCLFGMHVLPAYIFSVLSKNLQQCPQHSGINLSSALAELASSQRYLASELKGVRYNIGEKYGLLIAQLAIALAGEDRDNVLTELVELLAKR